MEKGIHKIPRKKKKIIPKGMYCYSPVRFPCEENKWVYEIKCCPFYKHVDGLYGKCSLLSGCEVEDQVKSCAYNYGKI